MVTYSYPEVTYSDPKVTHSDPTHLPFPYLVPNWLIPSLIETSGGGGWVVVVGGNQL